MPASRTPTMLGCWSRASTDLALLAGLVTAKLGVLPKTLTATERPSRMSLASYTSPPPEQPNRSIPRCKHASYLHDLLALHRPTTSLRHYFDGPHPPGSGKWGDRLDQPWAASDGGERIHSSSPHEEHFVTAALVKSSAHDRGHRLRRSVRNRNAREHRDR